MTRRKKPKNKTIVKEAFKYVTIDEVVKKYLDKQANIEDAECEVIDSKFIFPNDLDLIQPDSINGNLTIKFPE